MKRKKVNVISFNKDKAYKDVFTSHGNIITPEMYLDFKLYVHHGEMGTLTVEDYTFDHEEILYIFGKLKQIEYRDRIYKNRKSGCKK